MTPVTITKVQISNTETPDGQRVQLKARINGEKFKFSFIERLHGEEAWANSIYGLVLAMEQVCRLREEHPEIPREKIGLMMKDVPEHLIPEWNDWSFIRHEFRSVKNFV